MPSLHIPSLEHLATAVILLDGQARIAYLNPAAETLFGLSSKNLLGHPLQQVFSHTEQLAIALQQAVSNQATYIEHDLTLGAPDGKLHLRCAVTPLHTEQRNLLLEFHPID